ncbi:MAG: UvrD-helicase domain-containing protein [Candidatus Cloacimonetes bacterium]|nr:UvrD-helicase domain-containing protein [Candidatus Cloacimonadota bacterium]
MKWMIDQPITKIISASAGTGKTYRLSLEYITLILRYYNHPDFALDNILVITFTRKATAEIRERIQAHLHLLLYPPFQSASTPSATAEDHARDRLILLQNLRRFTPATNTGECGKQIMPPQDQDELSPDEYRLLSRAYHQICTQKHLLRVMTIDSFIGNIFRNLICPVRGIVRFNIDEDATSKRMPHLMPFVMSDEILNKLKCIFHTKVKPSLDEYNPFFVSLVELRWLYFLMTRRPVGADDSTLCRHLGAAEYWSRQATLLHQKCRDKFYQLFMKVEVDILSQDKQPEFKAIHDYYRIELIKALRAKPYTTEQLIQMMNELLIDPIKCLQLLKIIVNYHHAIYNGNKFRNKIIFKLEMEALTKEATRLLADHLVFNLLLPEQHNILNLWSEVLNEYDKLMYRYQNLSYDDVTWLTFEALYSDDPPLFDPRDENTANEFYHFLSHRTRFILVDEFQDTSILQFNILKPILDEVVAGQGSKPFGGFIVVGDEKQSIFGWREGERELLVNLPGCFPQCGNILTEPLTDCWRSSSRMLDAINTIFMDNAIHDYLNTHDMRWKYETISGRVDKLKAHTRIQYALKGYQTRTSKNPLLRLDRMRQFVRDTIVPNLRKIPPDETIAIIARRNSELTDLQTMLEEEGFISIFQPSARLTDHRLVYPLLAFIRFTVYLDWQDLLKVLHSDYILMEGAEFKQLCILIAEYERKRRLTKDPQSAEVKRANGGMVSDCDKPILPPQPERPCHPIDLSAIPSAQCYYNLMLKADDLTLSDLCLSLIDQSRLDLTRVPDRDLINLNAFLDLLREFEISGQDDPGSAADFLQYCEDKAKQELMKQRSIERQDALQLLTIHKSKGLEFDQVFFWYDLTPQTPRHKRMVDCFYQYAGQTFEHLHDFALSYQYAFVLEHSSWSYLTEQKRRREELEELNTLYVAVTRAKKCLYVMQGYQGTDDWETFLSETKSKTRLPLLFADSFRRFMQANGSTDDIGWNYGTYPPAKPDGEPIPDNKANPVPAPAGKPISESATDTPEFSTLSPILPPLLSTPYANATPNDQTKALDWKKLWLGERWALIGELVHFYLSFLIRNSVDERIRALENCLIRYGNIISTADIKDLCHQTDVALKAYPALFDPIYDKVFTEREIWYQGKEYRIDRLMVNTRDKIVWIVDFKTGRIAEPEQLDLYSTALRCLPFFSDHAYQFKQDYIVFT